MIDLNKSLSKLNWSAVGVCSPEISSETKQHYLKWLKNFKGPQMVYLEKRAEERLDPKRYFSQTRSILCFAEYYFPGWAKGDVKVSNYSWGRDYHLEMTEKVEDSLQVLKQEIGSFEYRIAVDTAPVLEKYWAEKSGIGWQGKNTLILNEEHGSMFFLGFALTSLPYKEFKRREGPVDRCGTCTRCIEACPTDALDPYILKADKCISYLNLEHKGDLKDAPGFEGWIAGCDICQEVCPWNQKLIPIEGGFDASFSSLTAKDIEASNWKERLRDKASDYIPDAHWQRNLEHIKKKTGA
jgi:epoxyqueuosine reductase